MNDELAAARAEEAAAFEEFLVARQKADKVILRVENARAKWLYCRDYKRGLERDAICI